VIVDAHVHAWARWPYGSAPDATTRGGIDLLVHEMTAAGVDSAVVVSAGITDNGDNNDYVARAVATHPERLHQFVDFDSRWSETYHRPGSERRLAELCDKYRPLGVSHYLAPDNDGWLGSDDARETFATADRRGLIVGLAARTSWFDDVCAIARTVPSTPILLNHLALVMQDPHPLDAAHDVVRRGAGQPNLVVKVSGYYYGSDRPWDYPYPDRLEIVRAFYETWGPRRMVWASDYPASAAHLTYRQSLEVVREHAVFIDPADLALVLGATMAALARGTRAEAL
jgi:L-fuconolactonase